MGGTKGRSERIAGARPRLVASLLTAALLTSFVMVGSQPARAMHNADLHSENMLLVATLDTGHGGDIAFWGDTAFLAHGPVDGDDMNDGFKMVDISDPTKPGIVGELTCSDSGHDISVWRDLVFLSVSVRDPERPDCQAPVASNPLGEPLGGIPDRFDGIHIVSIENPKQPELIHSVRTCTNLGDPEECGTSHTHTLVPDLTHRDSATGERDPRLVIYVNGGKQTVVEVPLRKPDEARVINRIDFVPHASSTDNGLQGCHDVSVFLPRNLAACAVPFLKTVQIWDITNPADPSLLSVIENPAWEGVHGSAFSWDGDTLIVADESIANLVVDQCPGPGTAAPQSALWFYDVRDLAVPLLRGYYQLDQPVTTGGCTAHQFNVVPLRSGRDVLVAGWGLGGTTVVDFTDPSNPVQLAHYRARPGADPDEPNHEEARSNPWSSYWYKGLVYANNMFLAREDVRTERGLDVFAVDHPLLEDHIRVNRFNSGTQECLPPPHGAAHGKLPTCETEGGG